MPWCVPKLHALVPVPIPVCLCVPLKWKNLRHTTQRRLGTFQPRASGGELGGCLSEFHPDLWCSQVGGECFTPPLMALRPNRILECAGTPGNLSELYQNMHISEKLRLREIKSYAVSYTQMSSLVIPEAP